MLKKSIMLHPFPLPRREREQVRGRKEIPFWQPICQQLSEQDRMKKGGFETSRSNRQ
jgi:predicted phosphoadenosine phosphosulfate sulfurtransferase